jgi:hypothetical protein
MKRVALMFFGLMFSCMLSFGQTNLPAKPMAKPVKTAPPASDVILPPARISHYEDVYSSDVSSQLSQVHARTFDRLESEGLRQSRSAGAFSPKIIRVGHVQIYSSVVTAVARKNPLCLLDDTFLNISF